MAGRLQAPNTGGFVTVIEYQLTSRDSVCLIFLGQALFLSPHDPPLLKIHQ